MNAATSLARAAQLHASGNLISARREAEAVLASDPDNLVALRFAGVLHCQSGDPARGAEFLRRAFDRDPADLPTRTNLLQALIDSEQFEAAEKIGADPAAPVSPQLMRARAAIARKLGRPAEAIVLLERAAAHAPKDWAIWNNLGNALNENDEPEKAVAALEKAKALNPGKAVVHLNLGRALAAATRYKESSVAFERAAQLDPSDGMALFEHGRSILRQGQAEQALPLLSAAARILRTNPQVFVAIGLAYTRADKFEQAEQSYRVAIHVSPNHGPAYVNLSILLERSNRMTEVEALLKEALDQGVEPRELTYVEALIKRRQGALAEALELARRSEVPSVDASWRAQFMGEVADKLGDVDTAFEAYSEMNSVASRHPDATDLERDSYRRMIEEFGQALTPDWYSSWPHVSVSDDLQSPAFLVGFFRSGTTLLDTILMGHPRIQVAEEEPMLAEVERAIGNRMNVGSLEEDQVRALRQTYFGALKHPLQEGKLLVDKNPLATLRSPIIERLFPSAPIVFALRHPCDVVLSCFMQNFQVSEFMISFHDLESAALVYDAAMSFWKKARQIFPLRVHEIRYEDIVEDVEGQMRPLIDFLGLPWDDRILDHQTTAVERGYIRTPSYAQVTEKIYRRASGRWTRYRKHMEPVLPILAPWVEEFGYSLD